MSNTYINFARNNVTDLLEEKKGKIADLVLKLSRLAQFHPLTMKTSKSVLKLSKPAQFRPFQSARALIQLN